jgi:hypothetical protein
MNGLRSRQHVAHGFGIPLAAARRAERHLRTPVTLQFAATAFALTSRKKKASRVELKSPAVHGWSNHAMAGSMGRCVRWWRMAFVSFVHGENGENSVCVWELTGLTLARLRVSL